MFGDRREAGRRLGEVLAGLDLADPLILALPRGGVPVAFEIAQRLGAPLDVLVVRKLGAPGQPELAMGAIVGGSSPQTVFNDDVIAALRVTPARLADEIARQRTELRRRRQAYAGDRADMPAAGRTVVVVDDGVATGASARAALTGLRQAGVARLVLAVPVGPAEVVADLRDLADEVVCLIEADRFGAVGAWYVDFGQTGDDEVVALLAAARHWRRDAR